jgi:hypothetical protein
MASIDAKIEQGGRLRHLLPKLLSSDQLGEDATGLHPFSNDMALCAMVPNQAWGARFRIDDLRTVACGLTGYGQH